MDFSYTTEIDIDNIVPLTRDGELALRYASNPYLYQIGAKEFYIDDTLVALGGVLEFEDSFRAWVILDVAVVLHKVAAIKLMMKILEEYSKMKKPIYAHAVDSNERLLEFLGFFATDVYVEYQGIRMKRWIYDRY